VLRLVVRGPHDPQGVPMEVLLPPGWQRGQPALLMVFLHDGRGTQRSFRAHGLAALATALMRSGAIPPVVIASPRHRGTFLIDSPRAEPRLVEVRRESADSSGLAVLREHRMRVDNRIAQPPPAPRGSSRGLCSPRLAPTHPPRVPGAGGARERRSVWGISMGGYGALKMALRHSEVFGRAAALAPWVQRLAWDDDEKRRTWWARRLLEPVFGRTREESRFEANDLYRIAESADPGRVPRIDVRTGSLDRWEAGAQKLVALLRARGIAVDAASIPGARHRWSDWRAATAGVLESLTR
jgi:enterochelin esterase-like enzyme